MKKKRKSKLHHNLNKHNSSNDTKYTNETLSFSFVSDILLITADNVQDNSQVMKSCHFLVGKQTQDQEIKPWARSGNQQSNNFIGRPIKCGN